MTIVFRSTGSGFSMASSSVTFVTPITNVIATSPSAGVITLNWSGGTGSNLTYSYSVSNGTIQTSSGINPTTITLTSPAQVTTTVTITITNSLGHSSTATSSSITTHA